MRALLAVAALASAAAIAAVGAVRAHPERVGRIAVPVLADRSTPRSAGAAIEPLPACASEERLRLPGRVTAVLAASDGALWAGTFDSGLHRAGPGQPAYAVGDVQGRELFVNDLAEHRGRIWAATQSGLLALAPDGRRLATLEPGRAVTALATVRGELHAGTATGLLVVGADGSARAVDVRGPDGERVVVSAMTESSGRLWLGSSSGAYSMSLDALASDGPLQARWHPLVFGNPPAETPVVTALAPLGDGALAGTDDGGLVRLGSDGSVRALRLADPRADQVNPGAAASVGSVTLFGTQGGGLLIAAAPSGIPHAGRPLNWSVQQVTALRAAPGSILAGTADGRVFELRCDAAVFRAVLGPGV